MFVNVYLKETNLRCSRVGVFVNVYLNETNLRSHLSDRTPIPLQFPTYEPHPHQRKPQWRVHMEMLCMFG